VKDKTAIQVEFCTSSLRNSYTAKIVRRDSSKSGVFGVFLVIPRMTTGGRWTPGDNGEEKSGGEDGETGEAGIGMSNPVGRFTGRRRRSET